MAQQAASPYIQQLYAASASPYGQLNPNMLQLMQSTGNPLLDMYAGQYAAMGYPAGANPAAAVTQAAVMPANTQSLSLDASQQAQVQANAAVAGMCHHMSNWSHSQAGEKWHQ